MIKKFTLALGCFALFVSLASAAMADAITFSSIFGGPATVQNTAAGLTASQAVVI